MSIGLSCITYVRNIFTVMCCLVFLHFCCMNLMLVKSGVKSSSNTWRLIVFNDTLAAVFELFWCQFKLCACEQLVFKESVTCFSVTSVTIMWSIQFFTTKNMTDVISVSDNCDTKFIRKKISVACILAFQKKLQVSNIDLWMMSRSVMSVASCIVL